MRVVSSFLSFALCWTIFSSTVGATVILSFSPASTNTFQTDSGIRTVSVFANSTLAAGEVGNAIGADFSLSGVDGSTTNRATFGSPAGTFGTGFLGAGNIVAGSTFNRGSNPSIGIMDIIFLTPQTVPSTATPLANLLINTNGLAIGTYNITTSTGFFGNSDVPNATGSFTITAVPEPTSVALLGVVVVGLFARRVLRKRKTEIQIS